MKTLVGTVLTVFQSAITCGATLLFALYRPLALVQVAASMAIGVELYFLQFVHRGFDRRKMEANKSRLSMAVGLLFSDRENFASVEGWVSSESGFPPFCRNSSRA